MISQERLKKVIHYDPVTGIFTWRVSLSNRAPAGSVCLPVGRGRCKIGIDGAKYESNRLAVLYMTGTMPSGVVDHRNGNGADDSWDNLRDVTQRINAQNIRAPHVDNKLGVQGVVRRPSGKYAAHIYTSGRQTNLGLFSTAQEAHAAYVEAKRKHHEGCTL